MRFFKRTILLLARLLLLALFVAYTSSITMFYHTHNVYGELITHSHPFNTSSTKIPVDSHSHTTAQLILLQHLFETAITDIIFIIPVIPQRINEVYLKIIPSDSPFVCTNTPSHKASRAPPSC